MLRGGQLTGQVAIVTGAAAVHAGVTCPHAARSLVQAALDRWGRVDILVNNAGVALYRLLLDTSVDEWDAIMAVHLRGAFNCSQAVLPHLLRAGRGRIINISSAWGRGGAANAVA